MFSFIVGPLPFCVPLASANEVGAGTAFPVEFTDLNSFCAAVWKVRTWRCQISGLRNEFATYVDHSFDFPNHAKAGLPPPTQVTDLIAGYGLNLEQEFEVLDSFGQANSFRLRLIGLDGGRHS